MIRTTKSIWRAKALRDRLLRALAEVENTRRRAERRVADAREYGISDFATELLSVVDSLQRALPRRKIGRPPMPRSSMAFARPRASS
jgi:molecular chaperone GrpE (heat shock protein)